MMVLAMTSTIWAGPKQVRKTLTNNWRNVSTSTKAGNHTALTTRSTCVSSVLGTSPWSNAAFDAWEEGWRSRLKDESNPEALMARTNPWVIPRNHRMEEMIQAAVARDFGPFERLNRVLASLLKER